MAEDLEGFAWDTANVEHILRYAVTPFDVEEAARTVTAYEMNAIERRKYASQID